MASIRWFALQLMALGMTVILVGLAVAAAAALGAARLTTALRARPRFALWLNRMLGGLLISLGLRLALQQRA